MRMRAMAAGAWAVGLVVALAGPAAAKGPTEVTVTYPDGAEVDIDLTASGRTEGNPGTLVEDMGLWSMLDPGAGVPDVTPSPPDGLAEDGLGPRYEVTWTMYDAQEGFELVQYLYPDAPGGALVHSPGGQPAEPYSPETSGGWLRSPGDPAASLAALGVDLDAPASPPAGAAAPAAAGDGGGGAPTPAADGAGGDGGGSGAAVPVVPLAALAAVVAASGVVAAARHRGRRAAPAPG